MNPAEPDREWPECPIAEPDETEAARIVYADTVAAAIQRAAIDILATGICPHTDGGIVYGRPLATEDCCGEVVTGIVTPQVIAGACFSPLEFEWVTKVSWCEGKQSVANQSRDATLLMLRLTETAECLLAGETPRWCFRILGADNTNDGTACQNLFLTIRRA